MLRQHLQHLVKRSLADFPVVLITGARQISNSTLIRALIGSCAIGESLPLGPSGRPTPQPHS